MIYWRDKSLPWVKDKTAFFLIFFCDMCYRNSAFNVIVTLKEEKCKKCYILPSKTYIDKNLGISLYGFILIICQPVSRWTNWWTSTAHVVWLFWGFPAISSVIRRTAVTRRFCLSCFTFDLAMDLFRKLRCSLKSRWVFKIWPVCMSVQQADPEKKILNE